MEALTTSETGGGRYGHPINQLLYECCQGQQKECGCGVTTLVCLTAFWSEGILKLINEVPSSPPPTPHPPHHSHTHTHPHSHTPHSLTHTQNVPLPVVFTLFDEAIHLCSSLFSSLSISLESMHHHLPQGKPLHKQINSSTRQPLSQLRKGSCSNKYSKVRSYSRHFSSQDTGIEVEGGGSSQHTGIEVDLEGEGSSKACGSQTKVIEFIG